MFPDQFAQVTEATIRMVPKVLGEMTIAWPDKHSPYRTGESYATRHRHCMVQKGISDGDRSSDDGDTDQYRHIGCIGVPGNGRNLACLACCRAAGLPTSEVLRLCVGDTLDEDRGRKAFPKNKSELINASHGQEMFDIARTALVEMAAFIPAYAGAASRPNKFCHGFGMFQLDLQFFKTKPNYFLQRRYETFTNTLGECLKELKTALVSLNLQGKTQLTDMEAASVAIFYNSGRYVPAKGLKQGYFDGRKYYGENYFDYLRLAHTVALDGEAPLIPPPLKGEAILPPVAAASAEGAFLRVDTQLSTLKLRREPEFSTPSRRNVIAYLPDGHPVRAVSSRAVRGFRHVETILGGALLQGYCHAKFLAQDEISQPPVIKRTGASKVDRITPATMPATLGRSTRRREEANALSLNEPGQPCREGLTADELRTELATIIHWLAVDNPKFKRYESRLGLNSCSVYAHDYCHLAGAYLPRVWWTSKAIVGLTMGERVKPLIGNTIDEVSANGLFRWLRDHGPSYGWRKTASLTELQQTANQGGIGLIVSRRMQDGKSGHVAVVAPETEEYQARRNTEGEVTNPLQSQAAARNCRYGFTRLPWWQGEEFAESAFWMHG
jgi:hypothetical protein